MRNVAAEWRRGGLQLGEEKGSWVEGRGSPFRRLGITGKLVTRSFMAGVMAGGVGGECDDEVQGADLAQASFRNSCSVFCSTASTKSS